MTIEAALKRVVRGELSWTSLRRYGVGVQLDGPSVTSEHLAHPIRVSAEDLAAGIGQFANDPGALRMWARVVHGSPGLFELALDDNPEGEAVLDFLWRVSFGEMIAEKDVRGLLERLRG